MNLINNDVNDWILENIKRFKIWHHPIKFNNDIIVNCTDENNNPVPDWDEFHGVNKWNKMIKPFIKNIKGKRILDLGCNTGIIDIELYKLGASEIIGIDKGKPFFMGQDYIQQANFVKKAFELKDETIYPITYYPCDLNNVNNLKKLNLGYFDLILALRVLNYLKDEIPNIIKELSNMTTTLVIQTNLEGYWEKDKWSKIEYYEELLQENNFSKVIVKYPKDYPIYPLIIGKK